MNRFLIKSGKKSKYLLLLILCLFLMIWQRSQQQVDSGDEEAATRFFQEEQVETYEDVIQLWEECYEEDREINSWVGYPGKISKDTLKKELLGWDDAQITLDMVKWKQEQESAEGRWTSTRLKDLILLYGLKDEIKTQFLWKETAGNQLEFLSRNSRRYRGDAFRTQAFARMTEHYRKAYENLEATCQDRTTYVYPKGIRMCLMRLEEDFGNLVILLLSSFSVFVTVLHSGIGAQGMISQLGAKLYFRKLFVSQMVIGFVMYWCYMILFLIPWGSQVLRSAWLVKPVQILEWHETFPYAVTVAGYLLLVLCLKCILAMAMQALFLGISFVSKNAVISILGGGVLIAVFVAIGGLNWTSAIFEGIPYFPLGTYPVAKWLVLVVGCVILVGIMWILIPLCGKSRILGIYSGRK